MQKNPKTTDAQIKAAILQVLGPLNLTPGSEKNHPELHAAISVCLDIDVQVRRVARVAQEMVKAGTLRERTTVNWAWGFKVPHYSLAA